MNEHYLETYGLVPFGENSFTRLFEHSWMMEFLRSNTPVLDPQYQEYEIQASTSYALGDEKNRDYVVRILLHERKVSLDEVADAYERLLLDKDSDVVDKAWKMWPGGKPSLGEDLHITSLGMTSSGEVSSAGFEVRPPWPSKKIIASFVEDMLQRYGPSLAGRPTHSEATNWLKTLGTTALVEFAGYSSWRGP